MNPMRFGPRIAYLLGGNRHTPRAAEVKLFCADGVKEMKVVAVGPLKRMIETIVDMAPARLEAYDAKGKLLRSLDMTTVEDPDTGELTTQNDPSSETTTHVTREERLLSHFAKLLADSRKAGDDMMARAFKSLVSIAEHHANRASSAEARNSQLQNALVRQTQQLVQAQVNAVMAQKGASEGDEGDDAVAALVRRALEQQANGPNGGSQ